MVDKSTAKEIRERVFGLHNSDEVDNFEAWTKRKAKSIAKRMGITLTDQHWEVVDFLRIHYSNTGAQMPPAHEFSQTLEERFHDEGGLKYLYNLFPGGPIHQGGLMFPQIPPVLPLALYIKHS